MAGPVNTLPKLREDLRLSKAAPTHSGAPSWVIHDPAAAKFFQISFETFQFLSLWDKCATPDQLIANVSARFGRTPEQGEISAVLKMLTDCLLLQEAEKKTWRELHQQSTNKQAWYKRAFHSYLFFKLPLVQPQSFLAATWPLVRFLFSKTFVLFTVLIGLIGLYLVSRQWESFINTFPYVFSFEGAMVSLCAIIFVKSLHELGHAYMAYRYGCFVPTLGVAFMAFVPMLYTDVTEAWKLQSRKQRLMIDSAGIQVELLLGMLCLFLWAFLPDGPLRSAVFVTATVSWIFSLAINLSPLMRFDGYFILSDLLGMPNLHERTFAHMRYRFRRILFANNEIPPENFTPVKDFGIFVFGIVVSIYRLSLYIGIALLVYHFFIKIVGIALLIGEVMFFIVQPLWRELKLWWSMRKSLVSTPRTYISSLVAIAGVVCLFLPLSGSIEAPALLEPEKFQRLFPEASGQLAKVHFQNGAMVKVGDPLFEISAPTLTADREATKAQIALLNLRLQRIAADQEDRDERQVIEQELVAARAKADGLEKLAARLIVVAQIDGQFSDFSSRIYVGKWIGRAEFLGVVKSVGSTVSRGFISGIDLPRIAKGNTATFIPDDLTSPSIVMTIASIAETSSQIIDLAPLASTYGGDIAVIDNGQHALAPVTAQYGIKTEALEVGEAPTSVQRGVLRISAKSESLATAMTRQVLKVLIRESGV
jgi:putative peptide zinc metalloprotease protein